MNLNQHVRPWRTLFSTPSTIMDCSGKIWHFKFYSNAVSGSLDIANSVRYISISVLETDFFSPMLTLNWSPSKAPTFLPKIFGLTPWKSYGLFADCWSLEVLRDQWCTPTQHSFIAWCTMYLQLYVRIQQSFQEIQYFNCRGSLKGTA